MTLRFCKEVFFYFSKNFFTALCVEIRGEKAVEIALKNRYNIDWYIIGMEGCVLGQVLTVTSGKGGTGKTTLCAAIASCLAAEGQRVLCIDLDVGMRNLDISLGMTDLASISFADVADGRCSLSSAAQHPEIEGLFLLTAPVLTQPELLDGAAFGGLIDSAREQFDWVLIDAPAGVGAGFRLATRFADRVLVVATPDPASLRDASRTAELLEQDGQTQMHVVVNRVIPKLLGRMRFTIDDVMDGVGLPLIGIVPDDYKVVLAAASGTPLVLFETKGAAAACLHIARRLCGRKVPLMKL